MRGSPAVHILAVLNEHEGEDHGGKFAIRSSTPVDAARSAGYGLQHGIVDPSRALGGLRSVRVCARCPCPCMMRGPHLTGHHMASQVTNIPLRFASGSVRTLFLLWVFSSSK